MVTAQTTLEVMTADVTLGTWEMDSTVKILTNAMKPIRSTTVTLMLTVPTLMEVSIALATLATLGMVSAVVSVCVVSFRRMYMHQLSRMVVGGGCWTTTSLLSLTTRTVVHSR